MLRWLVVGIGDITTRRVLPAILSEPRSRLAGLVTRDPAKAEPYSVPAWTDLAAALSQSGAGAVYIGTPVFLHAPQTIASLRAGAHVLCEKPMALNYTEAAGMREAARQSERTLGIAYYRRTYPKVERTRQLIQAGAIGRPVFAEATSHGWSFPTGSRAWLVERPLAGGGPLRDVASHRIDLMNYLFGDAIRACGQTSTLIQPTEVEDNATVLMEHPNGVRSMVDVRWHSRIARDEFRIRGTDGEIELTPLNGPALVHPGGIEDLPPHPNLHFPCIQEFVNAVLDGGSLRSTGASALATEWVMAEVDRAAGSQ